MSLLSIIVPCYNEEKTVSLFYKEFLSVYENEMTFLNYEIIFINDGSVDNTLSKIKELHELDKNVKYISFSRNFGKESALLAGLENSKGDYIAVIDADLQDPPSLLPHMLNIIQKTNYDIVGTRRISRKGEPPIRSFFANIFYKIINSISDLNLVDGARDFRMMTRPVVNSIVMLREYNRFSKGLFNWVGFKTKWLEYENIKRIEGETSWSFWSLFQYSIEGIVAFSTIPLHISTILGIVISILSFLLIIIIVLRYFLYNEIVTGWTSTICITLFLSGIQLLSIGILGKYMEKTYMETKKRPIYIIDEKEM